MNNVLVIGQIIDKNLQELQLRNDLSKESKDIYERISFDLNLAGINNKINLKKLFESKTIGR